MQKILNQVESLGIPYPNKNRLRLELEQDLELAGAPGEEAWFSDHDLRELENIHSTSIHQLLSSIGKRHRQLIETSFAFIPLAFITTYFIKEDKMIQFIREGGAGMYLLLAIGGFLLCKELIRVLRLLIVKDHSRKNLQIDTTSVWLGSLALICIGVGNTVLGIYVSASAVEQTHASYDLLVVGIKESLTSTILSTMVAALIVLAHYGTRQMLLKWRAPIS